MEVTVKLEEVYNLSALGHSIDTAIQELESDTDDNYDVDDGKEITVETVVNSSYGVYQPEALIEMLGIKNQVRDYVEVRNATGVLYLNEVWDEVLDPIMNDLAEQILEHFDLTDKYSLYFDSNEDDCGYDMFLFKPE